jgi:uncharacterized protein (DUF433 family)
VISLSAVGATRTASLLWPLNYTAIAKGGTGLYDIEANESAFDVAQRAPFGCKKGGPKLVTEHPRIALAPDILAGKPVICGTRLSVEFIIGLMAEGWTEADILANYAGVTHDDIIACLAYARDMLSSEKVFPSAA